MFDVRRHLRRRVHISHQSGHLNVRIARQNSWGVYVWMAILSTVMFGEFCSIMVGAQRTHPHDGLYILPVFGLGLAGYLIAITIAVWGAFGIEEIEIKGNVLRWRRTALKWSHTRDIPVADITEINAVTPWHGLRNTVELIASGKSRYVSGKLLRDEAIELTQHLRHAAHLHQSDSSRSSGVRSGQAV
jgi:hypothetical protein